MIRFWRTYVLFFMIILLFGCAGGKSLNEKDLLFDIKRGDTLHSVIKKLKDEKIINNQFNFQVLAKLRGKDSELKYGTYLIEKEESYSSIIDKFTMGKTYSIKIVIPEGFSRFQIAELLAEKEIAKKENFLKLTETKEGLLYPDTYLIPVGSDAKKMIEIMTNHFREIVNNEYLAQIKEKGLTLNKVLTMASIVEKEARMEFEKPIIAGVYYNRLRIGMKLQADPTLVYALMLKGTYDGDIRFRDFSEDSKYNTYKYYGLPPGPIANPGKTAILAAIYPADVDYLYFVAKPDGSHYFSSTLEEHNRAVYQYQKLPAIERWKNKKKKG